MSIVWREDWSGDFTDWHEADGAFGAGNPAGSTAQSLNLRPLGCGGDNAFVCSYGQFLFSSLTSVNRDVASITSPLEHLSVRYMKAIWGTAVQHQMLEAANTSGQSSEFSCVFFANADGSITFQVQDNGATSEFTTASGVVPFDGTLHAYQFTLDFGPHDTVQAKIVVDNVEVLNQSFTATAAICLVPANTPWGHFNTFANCATFVERAGVSEIGVNVQRWPATCGVAEILSMITEVEVDNDSSVIDYMPCSGATVLSENICSPLAEATDLDYDCDTERMTITGTGFSGTLSTSNIDLRDIEGIEVSFDIVSQTDTEIVLENLDPAFRPGDWGVTVTNPCT